MIIFNYCVKYQDNTYHTFNLLKSYNNRTSGFDKVYHFKLWFSELSYLVGFDRGNILHVNYSQQYHLASVQQVILYQFCVELFNEFFNRQYLTSFDLTNIIVSVINLVKEYSNYGILINRRDKRYKRYLKF